MSRAERLQWALFVMGAGTLSAASLAGARLPQAAQVALLVAAVSVAGLPHGALDPLVARRLQLWRTASGLALFLTAYILLAGMALGGWLLVPGAAWSAFLAVSAWHFSGDWERRLPAVLRASAGLAVVTLPALVHGPAVERIFSVLTDPAFAAQLVTFLGALAPLALTGLLVGALSVVRSDRHTAIELALLALSGLLLPPLLFFVLYFCGLHSPRHLIQAARGVSPRLALATGALFTGLAIGAGSLAWLATPGPGIEAKLLRVTFVGLAALTVPHMLLIELGRRPASAVVTG